MSQREPIPVLREDERADDGLQVGVTGARLQAECDVATTTIDNALCQNGAELCHRIFVLAGDDLRVQLTEESDLRAGLVGVLNQNHGRCNL